MVTLQRLIASIWLLAAMLAAVLQPAIAGQYGTPLLSNFKPKDYNGGTQNWAIAQDQRGLLYVGNNVGIMQYDGAHWRMIPTRNKAVVRSLAVTENGRIYVGSKGEIGYIDPTLPAKQQYVSLLSAIPSQYRQFQDVRQTFVASDGIYFISRDHIFRYQPDTTAQSAIKVWTSRTTFLKAFQIQDRLLVKEQNSGLLELQQGDFSLLAGSEAFADINLFMLEQFDQNTLLAGSREGDLYQFHQQQLSRWHTTVDPALRDGRIYSGLRLYNGDYAIATSQNGLFIIGADGTLKSHINKAYGLVDQNIRALFQDHQQGLWLALDHGLSRIDLSAAMSQYNSAHGLHGNVLALHQHQARLYAGTSLGLFRSNQDNQFEQVAGLQKQTWDFLSLPDSLLVANSEGVYSLTEQQATLVRSSDLASKVLYRSVKQPQRVFIGLQNGLASMLRHNDNWQDEGQIDGVSGNLNSLLETPDGELWLGSLAHGVYRLTLPDTWPDAGTPAIIAHFSKNNGLPSDNRNTVHWYQGQLLVATVAGFYRFDAQQQRFYPDTALSAAFAGLQPWVRYPRVDSNNNLWLLTWDNQTGSRQAGVLRPDDSGAFHWQTSALQPLLDIPLDTLLIDQRDIVWLGGAEGVFRFAINEHRNLPAKQPLLRRVRALNGTVFYQGGDVPSRLDLPSEHNQLRFDYASPNYSHLQIAQFQVKLQGHDNDWSDWSEELYRDYTNLPSGHYQFLLRSRDQQGNLLYATPLHLHIATPWYASTTLLLIYAVVLALAIYLLLKWRTWHLLKDKQRLTMLVEQHTGHLQHTMQQLELAKQSAEAATQAKSEFLANMSHELRTPLNAVLGFAELAQQTTDPQQQNNYVGKIRAAGKILLSIINDILDFSKIEAGKLELECQPFSLRTALNQVCDMFSAQLTQKKLAFSLQLIEPLPDSFTGDSLRLSQVLINLLSNAIKFTEQGKVTLTVSSDCTTEQCQLHFVITDTGIGISEAQQQRLFSAFDQGDSSVSRKYGGTGLGLTICQRLLNLMQSQLQVKSQHGHGSSFSFTIRLPQAALPAATNQTLAVPENTQANGEKILLVEDNYFNQALAQIILQKLGYQVLTATDGANALSMLQRHKVALVLMDIEMPGINGYDTTRQIRQLPGLQQLPVIAMTAHHSQDTRQRCLAAGMNDLLVKPIDATALAQLLTQWLAT